MYNSGMSNPNTTSGFLVNRFGEQIHCPICRARVNTGRDPGGSFYTVCCTASALSRTQAGANASWRARRSAKLRLSAEIAARGESS